ncbi:hypothetical protein [Blastomonas sp. UPD001]|jgi:hypothetical protein|uniref:hypothetical protein n=1 Tax=Blastomonas sp. UPD001 TaxID=2217673 RepID=UPI0013001C5F|nr:hypothetical protein [Blastomonas sp. UPD001]
MVEQVPKRTVGEQVPDNFIRHQLHHEAAEADRRYMLQRRDQFSERLILGVLALNGGSLVALLGVLGSKSTASALGFTPGISIFSVSAFVVGIVLSGFAANQRETVYMNEASDAGVKVHALVSLTSHRDDQLTNDNWARYGASLDEMRDVPVVGFQWNALSIYARHLAGGAWLSGITAPLLTKLGATIPPIESWWPF